MNKRTLLATATAVLGLVGGGMFHQVQAIESCGDLCDEFLATAEAGAPGIIPDDTKSLLFNSIYEGMALVTIPGELSQQEQLLLSTINATTAPFQATVISTESYALRSLDTTIDGVTSLACEDKHGDDHPGGGNGHDKNEHC